MPDTTFMLFLGIIIVLVIPFSNGAECYQCDSRQKYGKSENCSDTEEDCEGCLKGLQEYTWTPYSFCGPEGITIVEKDMNASLSFSSYAVLQCQFEEPIDCIWQKNDLPVDILQFVTGSNGTNTTDCSIEIEGNINNAGIWDCKSLAEDDKDAIDGSRVGIVIKATVTEVIQNSTIHSGKNVTLTCHFDMPVSCFWMHNGSRTQIENRFHFIGGSNNGQGTADCSISITDFHDEDVGEWKCGCQGDSSLEETLSTAAWLSKYTENDQAGNKVESPEWAIVLAVVGSIVALIVIISIVLACVYGCGVKYKTVNQQEYELGETINGRPPVLLKD